MATSSILGGNHAPTEPKGTDVDILGPSDSSDSDATGPDDRASAEAGLEQATNMDILPERVGVFPDAAFEVDRAADDSEAVSAEELVGADDGAEEDEESA